MTTTETKTEHQQIEEAIAAQGSLRGQVDDAIIDATIATLKEKLAIIDSAPEQQRKLATILFMDIADHTALTRGMDPEDQMALIDPLIARENDPEQVIRAGLAIQAEAEVIAAAAG